MPHNIFLNMNIFLKWDSQYFDVCLAILVCAIGFIAFWFISIDSKIKAWFFNKYSGDRACQYYISFKRLVGMIFMGILPGILIMYFTNYSLAALGLRVGNLESSLFYLSIVAPPILVISFLMSKSKNHRSLYPQMRLEVWNKKTYCLNTIGWMGYLFMYEFLFRGILLMACYNTFGFWPALVINLSIYALAHVPKGMGETLASFPFGILVCCATLSTGSLVFAFGAHLVLALSMEYFSISYKEKIVSE